MQDKEFRYRLKLAKLNELRFLSHLDWQNLILKTLRRCGVRFALTEGFNKVPRVSFSPALPIFIESVCELFNFVTLEPLPEDFGEVFKNSSTENLRLLNLEELPSDGRRLESLESLVQWASYEATVLSDNIVNKSLGISNFADLSYTIDKCLSSNDLFMEKKTKKGILKQVNYRNSVHFAEIKDNKFVFILKTGQSDTVPAFRADEFLKYLSKLQYSKDAFFEIRRLTFFDKDFKEI